MCKPGAEENRVLAAETFFRTPCGQREIHKTSITFDTPVNITEIHILSPSMYINTPTGGFMLGATEPSQFAMQFFCNNIDRPSQLSAVYVNLGKFNYNDQQGRHVFACQSNIWTNKLFIKAKFSCLSVVVYGNPKNENAEFIQNPNQFTNIPVLPIYDAVPSLVAMAANNLYVDMDQINDNDDEFFHLPLENLNF